MLVKADVGNAVDDVRNNLMELGSLEVDWTGVTDFATDDLVSFDVVVVSAELLSETAEVVTNDVVGRNISVEGDVTVTDLTVVDVGTNLDATDSVVPG